MTATAAANLRRRGRGSATVRILAVGNMYPPQHAGGYEFAWQNAVRYARSLGHEVRIVVSEYREDEGQPEEDPDVHRDLTWYWDPGRYEFPDLNPLARLGRELRNAATLRRHLREFKPDLVTWWSMGCLSQSLIEQVRRRGIPAVFVAHDDWIVYNQQHDQWIRMWRGRRRRLAPVVERLAGIPTTVDLNLAGPFVFNSRYTLGRARENGVTAPVMTVVHPGIDELYLDAAGPRPWRWRLLYVGRLDRQKGVDTAVAALAFLPPAATLTVYGSGDDGYVKEMKRAAGRIGAAERVSFEGFATSETLQSAYADADVVVFPVRWNEPFGLVPLEAMGMGRPVVTTARGGTSEFVRDGENALLFAGDDAAALARCVERLAADEGLRSRLRSEGFRTAARFTATDSARHTVEEILRLAVLAPAAERAALRGR